MEPVDIVLLILIALGAYEGYKKGLLLSIVGLIGFVLAIILGVYFMEPVSKYLAAHLKELTFAFPIIAFLIVFGITMAVVGIAGWILKKMMNLILLGGLDSIGGAILAGLLLGLLEGVASGYLDPLVGGGSRDLVVATILILTILIRPHGLFGRHDIERI